MLIRFTLAHVEVALWWGIFFLLLVAHCHPLAATRARPEKNTILYFYLFMSLCVPPVCALGRAWRWLLSVPVICSCLFSRDSFLCLSRCFPCFFRTAFSPAATDSLQVKLLEEKYDSKNEIYVMSFQTQFTFCSTRCGREGLVAMVVVIGSDFPWSFLPMPIAKAFRFVRLLCLVFPPDRVVLPMSRERERKRKEVLHLLLCTNGLSLFRMLFVCVKNTLQVLHSIAQALYIVLFCFETWYDCSVIRFLCIPRAFFCTALSPSIPSPWDIHGYVESRAGKCYAHQEMFTNESNELIRGSFMLTADIQWKCVMTCWPRLANSWVLRDILADKLRLMSAQE